MIDPGKLDVREMTEAINMQEHYSNYKMIRDIVREIRIDVLVGREEEAKKKATKLENVLSSFIRSVEE